MNPIDFVVNIPLFYVAIIGVIFSVVMFSIERLGLGFLALGGSIYAYNRQDTYTIPNTIEYFKNASVGFFQFLGDNMYIFISAVFVFFVVGAIWSIFKWNKKTSEEADCYEELLQTFLRRENVLDISELTVEQKEKLLEYIEENYRISRLRDNKSLIISWILNWPFTLLHYIFVELLGDFANYIYKKISRVYEEIALRNSMKYRNDMETLRKNIKS